MAETAETLVSLIKNDWEDIHHSRNQDWKFWAVLAAVGAGLATFAGKPEQMSVIGCLLLAGGLVSGVGALVSWSHWELLCKKTAHIEWMEAWLARLLGPEARAGLPYQGAFRSRFPDRWIVSGMIFAVYVVIAIDFLLGLLLFAFQRPIPCRTIATTILFASVLVFVGTYWPLTFHMARKRVRYRKHFQRTLSGLPAHVLVADTDALNKAAQEASRHLVKLVVPSLRESEEVWSVERWKVTEENRLPVLLLESNLFEMSFAAPNAAQVWHSHEAVFEVYVSESAITVSWIGLDKAKQTVDVMGCVIIPPGQEHYVVLSGPTFVFQVTADGIMRVSDSKPTASRDL
jgi:mannose-6-phosphate isomerase-like protein (cupin superfamily)